MAIIAHASISENGTVNGQPGDQTGKEVCKRSWYSKPWSCVIRFTDPVMAERVAQAMEQAAANDNIGYSQAKRNTLLTEARRYGYDISKVVLRCNCDCSSLVSIACMYAGIPESKLVCYGNCCTTRTLRGALKATGEVDIYTTPYYTSKSDKLQRGDILLKEGSHVAVVVEPDARPSKKTPQEIAQEVRQGKWGNGKEREERIKAAGYDYEQIRAIVNSYYGR